MAKFYDMSGKTKVVFTEEPELDITYKQIMKIIVKNATEERCKDIFTNGGVNLCPSEIFEDEIDRKQEEIDCSDNSIGCTKCWEKAIKQIEKEI